MAAIEVYPAMNGEKTLFPLFTKGPGPNEAPARATSHEPPTRANGPDGTCHEDAQPTKSTKPRKSRKKQIPGQKTLQEVVNPNAASNGTEAAGNNASEQSTTAPEEAGSGRSKRRRTSRTASVEVGGEKDEQTSNRPTDGRGSSPQVIVPTSSPLPTQPDLGIADAGKKTPPKKMLRLRAGGKFSSPVSKKPKHEETPAEIGNRRGRPRKSKEAEQEKHLVAVIAYDVETEIGQRINRILEGEERFKKQVKIVPKRQSTPRKAGGKNAHPFFNLDRRKEPQAPVQPSPRKASAVTPGKLRRETMNTDHARSMTDVPEVWTSTLLKDRLMFKHPGAKEPAWPDREQTHVRGLTFSEIDTTISGKPVSTPPLRKGKGARRPIVGSESILYHFAANVKPDRNSENRSDGFREPHPSLRLPERRLISGHEVTDKVVKQLSAPLPDREVNELSSCPSKLTSHWALQMVYEKVLNRLTAFDEGRGETGQWPQKYAPLTCGEVLQPTRQSAVLKDWLLSLKVMSVESAPKPQAKTLSKTESKPKKRKRRHKNDGLDDFLVDSDEEVRDMDVLTDPEDVSCSSQGKNAALTSIVQVAVDGTKLSNAVLLSGPHGCGKTAAAYAVAKELGFKVFEISSCERRSGKDVLDKVGDMTENHLVKHHGTDPGEHSSTEEPNIYLDEAFQRDLASGRQGKMASFFKPQVKTEAKISSPKKAVKAKTVEAVQNVLKKPKDQQQSLVLLEEVDVLFKEDKEFWSTVLKLIATSKRPFIMTCTDEDLVPLQAMSLHAILRFTPPPTDLAADYMLLIAAAEGHLLKRDAVATLYRSKDCDLRATLSELDFWCQMGVGDPRGGLSWMFQRYPPGADLDEHGRRLRVISDGTYEADMGSFAGMLSAAEDGLAWAWHEHAVDPSAALGWQYLGAEGTTLKDYCRLADDLSAADLYARTPCSAHLDVTQKAMQDKGRSHYIEGLPLLQADEVADFTGVSLEMLTTSTLLAFEARNVLSSNDIQNKLQKLNTHSPEHLSPAPLTRHAFACFDAISAPVESALSAVSGLQQSVFDGPLASIATDIAPYVRSIVHFDLALAEQRGALGGGKRARTTRAARSALEGGQRGSTRRERWFPKELNFEAVLGTAGREFPRVLAVGGDGSVGGESAAPSPSAESV